MRAKAEQANRSGWIPWAFVAFFGVVLATNAVMLWLAFTTWTGLETENAYQKGLAYNRALAAAKAQDALGWRVELDIAAEGERTARLEVMLADRHGDLIEDAQVSAAFVRPTHEGHDLELAVPHFHAGLYRAEAALPLAGVWELNLLAQSGGDTYRISRRVHLKP